MMNLIGGSQYRKAFVRLLALYCLLLPNSAVPPQDSADAPCSLQQEQHSSIRPYDPQYESQLSLRPQVEDGEQSTAHHGGLPGSTLPALGVPAPAVLDSEVAHSAAQPGSHTAFSQEEAAEIPDPRLILHSEGLSEAPAVVNQTASSGANIAPPAEVQLTPASDSIAGTRTEGASDSSAQVAEHEEEEERHNFALAKDGSKIVAANKEARKAESILDSDGDTFLKNECKADKWVLVELSQVTKVDLIKLSQYELYSSRVRDFEVFGRQSHPRSDGSDYGRHLNSSSWQLLGRFTAGNLKGTQAFPAQQPAWSKYLQLRFLTHYGSEPVCALNDVRVYGKSAVEDLEDRLALEAAPDSDDEQEQEQPEAEDAAVEPNTQPQPQSLQEPEAAGKETAGLSHPPKTVESSEGAGSDAPSIRPAVDSKPAPGEDGAEVQAGPEMSAGAVSEDKAAPVTEPGKAEDGTAVLAEVQGASGDRGDVATDVLEVLSAGLKRLISPPGTGKKRAMYSGVATSIDSLPVPAAPIESMGASSGSGKGEVAQGEIIGRQQGSLESERVESAPKASVDKKELVGSVPVVVETLVSDAIGTSVGTVPGMPTEAEAVAATKEGKGRDGQAPEKEKELLLAGNSAGSSKARNGGTVYDILVSEIKALKLQQKMVPRALSDLQKNVTSAVSAIAAEMSSFHQRIADLEANYEVPSICLPDETQETGAGVFALDSGRRSPSQFASQQDVGPAAGGVQQGLDMHSIAQELAALRTAAERANRREFAMVMVIAMLCALLVLSLPRVGSQNPIFRGAVILLALANGCVGLLLHYANALPALEKGRFQNVQGFVGI